MTKLFKRICNNLWSIVHVHMLYKDFILSEIEAQLKEIRYFQLGGYVEYDEFGNMTQMSDDEIAYWDTTYQRQLESLYAELD